MTHGDRLSTILARSDLGYNLAGNGASDGETMRGIDMSARNAGSVLKHILEVNEVAVVLVLGKIVGVVEVDDALAVSLDDVVAKQITARIITAPFPGHIVALNGKNRRILVGVFLFDFFVRAFDNTSDFLVDIAHFSVFAVLITIGDIKTGNLVFAGAHQSILDFVLDFFHGQIASRIHGILHNAISDSIDLFFG